MSKPYTESDFADQLDSDLTWRVRELSDLKAAIARNQPNADVLLRSLVTMLYAHWEGHVRFCATKYFDHLTLRKHRYDALEAQIYINSFLPRLDALRLSRVSVEERCQIIRDIMGSSRNRFSHINPSLIDTRSNLNSDVMRELCRVCAVDFGYFEAKAHFTDVILLKRRNAIAHGEDTYIGKDEVDGLIAEGISLMRAFKDALQNKIYTKSYLATPA